MLLPVLLSSMLTLAPAWSSKEILFSWEYQGVNFEYVFEIYRDRELTNIYSTLPPTTEKFVYATYYDTGLYFHRIKYYPKDSPQQFSYMYLGQLYVNMEEGYFSEDAPIPTVEEEEEEEIVLEITPPNEITEQITSNIEQVSFALPKNVDFREKIASKKVASTALSKTNKEKPQCNISLLKGKRTEIKEWDCNLDIKITDVKYLNWFKYYSLEIQGTYPKSVKANIKVYECKHFKVTDIDTWIGCKEILVGTYQGNIDLTYYGDISVNQVSKDSDSFDFGKSKFVIRNTCKEDIQNRKVKLNLAVYSQFKNKQWYDFIYTIKKDIAVKRSKIGFTKKPFSFPMTKLIGVTQWHGCTVYQCPHKGIDFGAKLEKVISIGDGEVLKTGFDKYGGECNQGGKYVTIKHTNGLYSAYIHLDSYSVKKGQKVKKGDLIGISGNTGMKNCQPFKYHLHFEVRKGPSSSTHVNPVDYVDVDWASIPTLGYKHSPGRLGGDNPHPSY